MNIHTLYPRGYFGSNCYLIEDNDSWAVIDPSVYYRVAQKEYPEMEGKIKYILLTHAHFDHIYAIDSWVQECDKVIIGEGDLPALADPVLNCFQGFLGVRGGYFGTATAVRDGDMLKLGTQTIRVISTPGHTPGGVSYKIGDATFVGDTIFEGGGYGRTDLPGGDEDELWSSIFKLFSQNMIGKFYPGHGAPDAFENAIKYFN